MKTSPRGFIFLQPPVWALASAVPEVRAFFTWFWSHFGSFWACEAVSGAHWGLVVAEESHGYRLDSGHLAKKASENVPLGPRRPRWADIA